MLHIENISKTFVLHQQGGTVLSVLDDIALRVAKGTCVVLTGQSGSGKSTLLRSLYGNYAPNSGAIHVQYQADNTQHTVDLVTANPRVIVYLRRHVIGWVSQFLRTIPRVSTLDLVKQPALDIGIDDAQATEKAKTLLGRLNIPQALWNLAPATFSGGEQQRVNIARGFMVDYPILLLDEPTASLDAQNREVVLSLIEEAKARDAAIIGIFHDEAARERLADFEYNVSNKQLIEK